MAPATGLLIHAEREKPWLHYFMNNIPLRPAEGC